MTPREVLSEMKGLGYRLTLRPGGLRLEGGGQPVSEVVALLTGHREALIALLDADARAWALHKAGLAAGRLTPFPQHLHHLVSPVLVRVCLEDEARLTANSRIAEAPRRARPPRQSRTDQPGDFGDGHRRRCGQIREGRREHGPWELFLALTGP